MDNHYVPNLTFGPACRARRYGVDAPIDVHLMVKPVDRIVPELAATGADYITFHPEASEDVDRTLQLIREQGYRAGLSLNPAIPRAQPWATPVLLVSLAVAFAGVFGKVQPMVLGSTDAPALPHSPALVPAHMALVLLPGPLHPAFLVQWYQHAARFIG